MRARAVQKNRIDMLDVYISFIIRSGILIFNVRHHIVVVISRLELIRIQSFLVLPEYGLVLVSYGSSL